ncbi:MAG TPA: hypothetical protein PKG93_01690 [Bacilli bacterium]|nr:hypothetical protein [Bacilli bacterium]HPZ24124.1 hypothetical protein [Bacilli bacterium]
MKTEDKDTEKATAILKSTHNKFKREMNKLVQDDLLYNVLLQKNSSENNYQVIAQKYASILNDICSDIFRKKYNIKHTSIFFIPPTYLSMCETYPITLNVYEDFEKYKWSQLINVVRVPIYCKFVFENNYTIIATSDSMFQSCEVFNKPEQFAQKIVNYNTSITSIEFKKVMKQVETLMIETLSNLFREYCMICNIDFKEITIVPHTLNISNNTTMHFNVYWNKQISTDNDSTKVLLVLSITVPLDDFDIRNTLYNKEISQDKLMKETIVPFIIDNTKITFTEYHDLFGKAYLNSLDNIYQFYSQRTFLSKLLADYKSKLIDTYERIGKNIIEAFETDLFGKIVKGSSSLFTDPNYLFSDFITFVKYSTKNVAKMLLLCEY